MQAMGKLDLKDLTQNIFDLIVTYRHTEEGTSLLITGKIDVEKATEIDCFYLTRDDFSLCGPSQFDFELFRIDLHCTICFAWTTIQ